MGKAGTVDIARAIAAELLPRRGYGGVRVLQKIGLISISHSRNPEESSHWK
jgi:hypothetical protein